MDDLNLKLQCEVQTGIYSNGGFTETNKAIARFALAYHKVETGPISFQNAAGLVFADEVRKAGLDQYWTEFDNLTTQYETAFNKQVEINSGGSALRILMNDPKSFTFYQALTTEMTDIINSTIASFTSMVSFVSLSDRKAWFNLGITTLQWSIANFYLFTPIGDIIDIIEGFQALGNQKYITGAVKVGLGLLGAFTAYKIVKSIGLLNYFVKGVLNPILKVLATIDDWLLKMRNIKGWKYEFPQGSNNPILTKTGEVPIDILKVGANLSEFYRKLPRYVNRATVSGSDVVMIGKFENRTPSCYTKRAEKTGSTYYDLPEDLYNEAKKLTNNDKGELWKINEMFLDNQINSGKFFQCSHNPYNPINLTGAFGKEVAHLKARYPLSTFNKVNDRLWEFVVF